MAQLKNASGAVSSIGTYLFNLTENRYHILPVDDLKPHNESGEWCKCAPEIRREGEHVLVIHNAYDGREFYEVDEIGAL